MATSATMTQLNMRVSQEDKLQSDEVLRLLGSSVTKLVRKVLAKVARGAEDAEELIAALDDAPPAQEGTALRSRAWFEESDRWLASMAAQLGVSPDGFVPLADDEYQEALYEDYLERERERLVHDA